MRSDQLHPLSLAVLHECGWYPGRRVGIDAEIQLLLSDSYCVDAAQFEVLTELAGLRLRFNRWSDPVEFDVPKTLAYGLYIGARKGFEKAIMEPICPVGLTGLGTIVITKSGKCCLVFDHVRLGKLFSGIEAAINHMYVVEAPPPDREFWVDDD